MSGHRLRRTHRQLAGMIAEGALDGDGFQLVAEIRRSAMGVDVVHILGLKFGIVKSVEHYTISAVAVLGRLCYVVSVPAHTVSDNFSQDLDSASAGKFQLFENKDS